MLLSADRLQQVIAAAAAAPSSHNTQPWRFAITETSIRMYADRGRALPINDPRDRELTISCGATVFNLRVALAHLEQGASVRLLPDPDDGDLLAEVAVTDDGHAPDLAELMPAVAARRTHHGHFGHGVLPEQLADLLTAEAAVEGARLEFAGTDMWEALASLVAQGDERQFSDRRWRRELASWMHSSRADDGLVIPLLALPATRLVVGMTDQRRRTGAMDAELVRRAPLLAVLTTDDDEPLDTERPSAALPPVPCRRAHTRPEQRLAQTAAAGTDGQARHRRTPPDHGSRCPDGVAHAKD